MITALGNFKNDTIKTILLKTENSKHSLDYFLYMVAVDF